MDATFPSNRYECFLCGLLCDLVKAEPGLTEFAYVEMLLIAVGYERHQRLLIGLERFDFTELCDATPLVDGDPKTIPWFYLKKLLSLREAIRLDAKVIHQGPEWDFVRKSYPDVPEELVALICKAGSELRDLQDSATNA